MSARDTLTPELRAEVLRLEDDLRARVAALPEVQSAWREEYDAARAAERTAAAWEAWLDERVTLAAVAWVLTTVFVRFCEDNGLVKPVWISGPREPRGARRAAAVPARDRAHQRGRHRPRVAARGRRAPEVAPGDRGPGRRDLADVAGLALRRRGDATAQLLARARRRRRARPRPHRPGPRHPLPRRPLPGPLRGREEAVRAAADPGLRRGVHPRPHAGAGAQRAAARRASR